MRSSDAVAGGKKVISEFCGLLRVRVRQDEARDADPGRALALSGRMRQVNSSTNTTSTSPAALDVVGYDPLDVSFS